MATYYAAPSSFVTNRPELSLGCGSHVWWCNRECSDGDKIIKFSRRLSVLMPLMWWIVSVGSSGRPIASSMISRCSLFPLVPRARLYPFVSPCLNNLAESIAFSSGCSSQYLLRASLILRRCSSVLGTPEKWTALSRRSIPNSIKRFLTVLRCTPNSSAMDCIDRREYASLSQSASFILSINRLYLNGNRLPT